VFWLTTRPCPPPPLPFPWAVGAAKGTPRDTEGGSCRRTARHRFFLRGTVGIIDDPTTIQHPSSAGNLTPRPKRAQERRSKPVPRPQSRHRHVEGWIAGLGQTNSALRLTEGNAGGARPLLQKKRPPRGHPAGRAPSSAQPPSHQRPCRTAEVYVVGGRFVAYGFRKNPSKAGE